MYYDRARYYSPVTGTFVSLDPSGFRSGDVNLFRYVGNSPVDSTDPTGLQKNDGDQGAQHNKEGELRALHAASIFNFLTFDYNVRLPATLKAIADGALESARGANNVVAAKRATLAKVVARRQAAASELAAAQATVNGLYNIAASWTEVEMIV